MKLISIIIIVKNDVSLRITLENLSTNTSSKSTEVIVVDASNNKLDTIRKEFPSVIWRDFISHSGKRITIPEQRNVGVSMAKGDIIVFVDASCTVEKDWLEELIKPIEKEGEKIVSGAIWSPRKDNIHDSQNLRNQKNKYLKEAPTMNLAIEKEVMKKVGIFDETFDYGSDVDLITRARTLGYKVRYAPKAVLYHEWGGFQDELKRAYRYGQARVNIYAKHNHKLGDLIRSDAITLIYPLFILFLPLAIIWPWYLLFLLVPLLKNIKQKPFETTALNLVFGYGILTKIWEKLILKK